MASARTVDEMILSLPVEERAIVKRLRDLVLECLPLATEKPYYGLGVPYYPRHRQVCYIFPPSALFAFSVTHFFHFRSRIFVENPITSFMYGPFGE